MKKIRGLVNRIITFSAVDGPGNRLVIFMQGCNLRCINCHNPHTMGLCTFCGKCVEECPTNALTLNQGRLPEINCDPTRCTHCDHCLEVCPEHSNPHSHWMDVEEIIETIRPVVSFISGITVSGGEASQQMDFVRALFAQIKADAKLSGLTTFIDSNGMLPRKDWASLLPVLDGAMIDLKAITPTIFQELTKTASNQLVLETIPYLYQAGVLYEIRLLVVPGYNDHVQEMRKTAEFLIQNVPGVKIRLIPFRNHGIRAEYRHLDEPDQNTMEDFKQILLRHGITGIYQT